jgi:hypothetical protein
LPCYLCDTLQTDPAKGASTWQRGVVLDVQVLVCPTCQVEHDWHADLDQCAECLSTRLVRRLGETTCSDCGHVGPGNPAVTRERVAPSALPQHSLADDVERALERVLRQPLA